MFNFNREWFSRHQKLLLWFANTFIGRRVLCINGNRSSVGKNKIILILPNAIFWEGKKKSYHFVKGKKVYRQEYVAEFRTHNKYSKRLFYAFYPLWWLAHQWDMLFANNIKPAWNLGFDTLTVYPDAGTGATTVDGTVRRDGVNETFATIRAGAGTGANPTSSPVALLYLLASTTTNQYASVHRGIFTFDTSALPDAVTISAATFSFCASIKDNSLGLSASHSGTALVGSTPASNNNLVAADYSQLGSTRYVTTDKAYADVVTGETNYNDMTLNATGIAAISKTGITKLGARFAVDLDAGTPAWVSAATAYIYFYMADQTGTDSDPKLVVTYTASAIKKVSGVPYASIKKISGVAIASIKKVAGVA
jgi:hypothetical protein